MITLENLHNKIILDERSNVALGEAINVTDKTIANIKDYLINGSKNEPKLEYIIRLARVYTDNSAYVHEIVKDFSKSNIGSNNLIKVMDYALENSLYDLLKEIINRCHGKNITLEKISKLYELLLTKKIENKKWSDIILKAKLVKSSDPVVKYLLTFIESLVVSENGNFVELEIRGEELLALAKDAPGDYLCSTYSTRALDVQARAKMKLFKYDEVRTLLRQIVKSEFAGDRVKASACFSSALTQFYYDYKACETDFKKAIYLYEKNGMTRDSKAVETHLFFAKCYHIIDLESADSANSSLTDFDRAYYLYQKGLVEESKQVMDNATYEDYEAPFISFMKGLLAHKQSIKRDYFRISMILFKSQGNMHYAQLPIMEMQKLEKEGVMN
ncbi:AimR family lysis-lysogeny pheromone receptor [Cytobacillus sp. Hm23]